MNITNNETAMGSQVELGRQHDPTAEGLEPYYQMVCRVRNRLAMQGDVLSAHARVIRNMPAPLRRPPGVR